MKTINYKLMGERIRRQRELLGLTREQLARNLMYPQSSVLTLNLASRECQ